MGKTVLMVVHEFSLAARFCSRLMLIGKHRLLTDGPPDDVLTPDILSGCYGVPIRVVKNPLTGTSEVFTESPADDGRRGEILRVIVGGP